MLLNCASLGITNLAPGSTQLHEPVLPWNLKSWMPDGASAGWDWPSRARRPRSRSLYLKSLYSSELSISAASPE